jgi:hypothetical protein
MVIDINYLADPRIHIHLGDLTPQEVMVLYAVLSNVTSPNTKVGNTDAPISTIRTIGHYLEQILMNVYKTNAHEVGELASGFFEVGVIHQTKIVGEWPNTSHAIVLDGISNRDDEHDD